MGLLRFALPDVDPVDDIGRSVTMTDNRASLLGEYIFGSSLRASLLNSASPDALPAVSRSICASVMSSKMSPSKRNPSSSVE